MEDSNQGIEGKWMMSQVIQSGKDVSAQHNPDSDRWIEFIKGGGFTSDGSVGRNTGKWTMGADSVLFIDSDVGEDDDSTWSVSIDGDIMTWKGLGSDFAKNFELVHRRVRE